MDHKHMPRAAVEFVRVSTDGIRFVIPDSGMNLMSDAEAFVD
jgi:hypothetical protein